MNEYLDELAKAAALAVGRGYLPMVLIASNRDGEVLAFGIGSISPDGVKTCCARVMVGDIDPTLLEGPK